MTTNLTVTIRPTPEFSRALSELAELAGTTDPPLDFDAMLRDLGGWYELVPDPNRAPWQIWFVVRPTNHLLRLVEDLKGKGDE